MVEEKGWRGVSIVLIQLNSWSLKYEEGAIGEDGAKDGEDP